MEEVVISNCPFYSNAGTSRQWLNPSSALSRITLFSHYYSVSNCHFCLTWWKRRGEAVDSFNLFLSEHTGVSCSFPPIGEDEPCTWFISPCFYLLLFSSASSKMLQVFPQSTSKRKYWFQSNQQSLCYDAVLPGLSMWGQRLFAKTSRYFSEHVLHWALSHHGAAAGG